MKGRPPSGQSFRQWVGRQQFGQAAPGGMLNVFQSNKPVRVPFFVVSFKKSPVEFKDNPGVVNQAAIVERIRQRIFGTATNPSDSLQGYYNQLFFPKLTFFDPADIIPLELDGSLGDYFTNSVNPRKKLFEDLKEALSHTQTALEVYNNKQLNGEYNATKAEEIRESLDLAVIFIMARPDQVWPLRWWYEWTGDNGVRVVDPAGPALAIPDPVSHKVLNLSNYCVLPVFGPDGPGDVISYSFLAHEMLHAFGLPDLYDRVEQSKTAGIGGWCAMAWGLYGGEPSVASPWKPKYDLKPVWPSAWCRQFLGVGGEGMELPRVPAEGDAQLVSPLNGEGKTFCRIDLPGRPNPVPNQPKCHHYLLVEFRGPGLQKEGTPDWDEHLAGAGFLIWEVREDIGRLDPFAADVMENAFWPCSYLNGTGQNDNEENPLVGLWWPGELTLKNLARSSILQKDQLWTQDDQVFKQSDGVVLSHFKQNGKLGTFHYVIVGGAVSPAPSPTMAASIPTALPPPPLPSATVSETTGEPQVLVASKLPSDVSDGLKNVFAAYPKFTHTIAVQGDQVKSVKLPAKVQSTKAFSKDVSAQLSLFNGKALGDSRAVIISATAAPASRKSKATVANLFKGTTAISKTIGVKVGDKVLPVAGTSVDIGHDTADPGSVRYSITPVKVPSLPQTAQTAVSPSTVAKFLQDRFHDAIPKNVKPELVVENGTGKLKWQFHIPTVPTSGPITIEVDASDSNGLSDKTPILIK